MAGGGFFVFAEVTASQLSSVPASLVGRATPAAPGGIAGASWSLAEHFHTNLGVGIIPASPFFGEERREMGERFVRVAFCKNVSVIEGAGVAMRGGGGEGEEGA